MVDLRTEDSELSLRAKSNVAGGNGSLVQLLSPHHRQRLKEIGTRIALGPRTIIYREATPATDIYVCMSGVAKSYRELRNGTRRIATFLFAHDLLGLAEEGLYVNTAQTISACVFTRLPLEPLRHLLKTEPDLGYEVMLKVTHELREAQRRALLVTRRDAVGRVAMFMKILEANTPKSMGRGTIAIPMSRSDIADYTGLSPEAVSRATRRLVRQGITVFNGRHAARVLDQKRLDELANAL